MGRRTEVGGDPLLSKRTRTSRRQSFLGLETTSTISPRRYGVDFFTLFERPPRHLDRQPTRILKRLETRERPLQTRQVDLHLLLSPLRFNPTLPPTPMDRPRITTIGLRDSGSSKKKDRKERRRTTTELVREVARRRSRNRGAGNLRVS